MASNIILLGFGVVFWCLQLLQAGNGNIPPPRGPVEVLAAAALVIPAAAITFGLTLLLLYAHVLALGRADAAAGGPGHRSVARLVKATLASAALLAGVVALWLVAGDGRLGGADDVGWLSTT